MESRAVGWVDEVRRRNPWRFRWEMFKLDLTESAVWLWIFDIPTNSGLRYRSGKPNPPEIED